MSRLIGFHLALEQLEIRSIKYLDFFNILSHNKGMILELNQGDNLYIFI